MDKDKLFEVIQKGLATVPLILIGTGGTMPYGIPGMTNLSERLQRVLTPKYHNNENWKCFTERLNKGITLEEALTNLNMTNNIIDDIVKETWELVNEADISLMKAWIGGNERPALGKIIKRFYSAIPQVVNVVTTNYDRVIEYSCDLLRMPVNDLFEGQFYKKFQHSRGIVKSQSINLLKVHGSLDWFYDMTGQVVSIPLQEKVEKELIPAIVTPGLSKYKRVLEPPFRDVIHIADEVIEKSPGFLCIGYGFNDSQIQANLIREMQQGKKIVILTKRLSDQAIQLVKNNSDDFIIVQAVRDNDRKTEIIMPTGVEIIDEVIWTQEGLLKII